MSLDWFSFLRQHNIPYTTTGPNASHGRVNVKCPYCGESDPSEHMGISTSGYGWSCWRNEQHRGKNEARLVATLLRCSIQEAEAITKGAISIPEDRELSGRLRSMVGGGEDKDKEEVHTTSLRLYDEFKSLSSGGVFSHQFLNYLRERNYHSAQMKWLVNSYKLHYAVKGRFAYRIIIPIYDRWNELLTWTGRTIRPEEELRYSTLKRDEQICSPKQTLLGLPILWSCANPKVLVVCEGPFDAFWVTTFGRSLGVYATCLFGLTMSPEQAELLLGLQERFDRTVVLLDNAASFQAFRIAQSGLNLGVRSLPSNAKDPAELSSGEVVDLCLSLVSEA